jgi:uncharacterized protein
MRTFLTAEWRKLALANYEIDPGIVADFLPYGTELDFFNGTCYVSLVGFMFQRTKVAGMSIPFHVNFEEVNLRFYVRHRSTAGWKRGVVFIKEIVPKRAITFVANCFYGEHYVTMPMEHSWLADKERLQVSYHWKKGGWHSFHVECSQPAQALQARSEAEFITEHYWGYTKLNASATSEYEVQHPPWEIYPLLKYNIEVDFGALYGSQFRFLSTETPRSVFLAEGSPVVVKAGARISR